MSNPSNGLLLEGCHISLYLCCSETDGDITKYADSFSLNECTSVHRGFKILETKHILSKREAQDLIMTSDAFFT